MIDLRDVQKQVIEPNGASRTLFRSVDFSLGHHEKSVSLAGRSGSGKSSLLRILAGLDTQYSGEYYFDGQKVERSISVMAKLRRKHIGYVTQHYDLLRDRNVLANVIFAQPKHPNLVAEASKCLEMVGLSGFERKKSSRLSGGEAQRVAIARAIVKRPDVILADEPTGALDEATEDSILELFGHLQDQGTKFIIATHSKKVMSSCDRALELVDQCLEPVDATVF
ncbi:ABC transporter ATP-binding protein [Glutamicibacter sp. HZAU]|uniref:ABC transporter ATP-binding protein n=1 Tax=Glutamicibacter sp. HZAU TaxID=2049891 RepID=UPI000FFBF361|nr:ATP-binding cassette domain-containing protein [Glutamicibacter sp. HZAU]RWZ79674.1 ATP-binding cassette domain-containing protein [Glutamicibacter sp. HZAU]